MSVPENEAATVAVLASSVTSLPASTPLSKPTAITPHPLTPSAVMLLVLINVLWGASSAASKYGLSAFGPCTLAVLRFLPAGLLLLCLAQRQGRSLAIRPPDRLPLFVLALVGISLTYSVFYIGIRYTNATDASLLFACEPLLLALMAVLFLRERLRTGQWLGLLVGVFGIWLIAGQAMGNRIALLALVFESSMSVIAKRLTGRYPGLLVVGWQLALGALCLLPFAAWEIARHPLHVTPGALAAVVYLCLINTTLCYGIWYRLMERFPLSAMGVFILVQPLCGPLFGWLLRAESLHLKSALGGALVIVGIGLTMARRVLASRE